MAEPQLVEFDAWWNDVSWTAPFVDPRFAASQAWLEAHRRLAQPKAPLEQERHEDDHVVQLANALRETSEALRQCYQRARELEQERIGLRQQLSAAQAQLRRTQRHPQ